MIVIIEDLNIPKDARQGVQVSEDQSVFFFAIAGENHISYQRVVK